MEVNSEADQERMTIIKVYEGERTGGTVVGPYNIEEGGAT